MPYNKKRYARLYVNVDALAMTLQLKHDIRNQAHNDASSMRYLISYEIRNNYEYTFKKALQKL